MSKITVAKTAGFCFGVDRAVKLCEKLVKSDKKIKTLGPIIHNPQVVEQLLKDGVEIANSPSDAQDGSILVIRSHGVAKDIYTECERLGIEIADATCPFVTKIHKIVGKDNIKKKIVLIAGDKNHPEVSGIIGHCAGSSYTFDTKQRLFEIFSEISDVIPVIMVAQTTFNLVKYNEFVEYAFTLFKDIERHDTICNATMARQQEARQLAKQNDVCVVIGGNQSSNTKKLSDVCSDYATTYQIETANQLQSEMFINTNSIGVTAGASTPAPIIKEVLSKMSEIIKEEFNFEEALENSMRPVHRNQRITGIVTEIRGNEVAVDIGRKQTGFIPADEMSEDPTLTLNDICKIGDELNLVVIKVNDQDGIVMLSKKKIDSEKGIEELAKACEDGEIVDAYVTEVVEKGLIATVKGVRVFIPGSQATQRRGEPFDKYLRQTVKIKILEVTPERRRAIGSISAVLSEERAKLREQVLSTIGVGSRYNGVVKSLTNYGAFVDIGGVDGMVHVSELSWQRIKTPADIVKVGDEIEVYVKDYDAEKGRISLGYRDEAQNPWNILKEKYEIGDEIEAEVASVTKFGAFVHIVPGIDGLVHISEIPSSADVKTKDIVKVKFIGIDFDAKRVSLTMMGEEKQESWADVARDSGNQVLDKGVEPEIMQASKEEAAE